MKEDFVQLILSCLRADEAPLRAAFEASRAKLAVRHCVIDELLPADLARHVAEVFPRPDQMRLMNSMRERKFTSKSFDQFDPLMAELTFAVQDPQIGRAHV